MDTLQQTHELIARDFELDEPTDGQLTEEILLQILANRIAWMIEHNLEYLLSLMYRLDISEAKVSAALHPAATLPANIGLAELVMERQKQRVFTKQHYKQPKIDSDDAW